MKQQSQQIEKAKQQTNQQAQNNKTKQEQNEQDQIKKIFKTIKAFLPKDLLPEVSEWAEKNRFMTSKVSNITGNFSYDNTPYAREIADCFSKNSPIREIAIMKGVQLGFTTAIFENKRKQMQATPKVAIAICTLWVGRSLP